MALENEKKYYVVKFLELPYEHMISHYVCVPHTWIRRSAEWTVLVSYPREDPVTTRKRVRRREPHGENWKLFVAVVKYDTDYFDDAEVWIQTMDDDDGENGRLVIDISEDPEDDFNLEINTGSRHSDVYIANGHSNNMELRGNQSSPSMDPTEIIPRVESVSTRNNHDAPIQLSIKRPLPLYARREIHKKLSKIYIPNVESSNGKNQLNHEHVSDQMSCIQQRNDEACSEMYDDNYRFSSRRNMNYNTFKMPTCRTSNQPCQSPYRVHNQTISVIPDDILFHGRKYYSNGEKDYQQDTKENMFALKDSSKLMKQSQVILGLHENPPGMENEEPQTIPDQYSPEIDPLAQRKHFQDARSNTSSNLRKFRNLVNSRKISEQEHDKQQALPSHTNVFLQDLYPNKVSYTNENSEKKYVERFQCPKPLNCMVKNASTFEQCLSSRTNQSCQVSEPSDMKQPPPDYNIIVRQDPNINQIIITRSIGVECNDTTAPVTINNTEEQNCLNFQNLPYRIPERSHEEHFSPPVHELLHQCPRASKLIFNPMKSGVPINHHTMADNIPAERLNSISQSSKSTYENDVPAKLYNYLNQDPYKHRSFPRKSVVHNHIYQRNLRAYPLHTTLNLTSNDSNQRYNKCLSEKQFPQLIKGYSLHDQCKGTFLKEPAETVTLNQRHSDAFNASYNPSYSKNMPAVRKHNMPSPINQSPQYFERLNKKQYVPSYGDYPLLNLHIHEVSLSRNLDMSDASQISVPNTPCTRQHYSNLENHICTCKCLHQKILKPCTQDNWLLNINSYQDPQMQQTLIKRNSTERDCINKSVYTQIHEGEKQSLIKSSPVTCPLRTTSAHLKEEQFSQMAAHLLQKAVNRPADQNCIYQNVCSKTNIGDRSSITQSFRNKTKQSPIDEPILPIDIESSDEEISTEEISVRKFLTNYTSIKQNSHPKTNIRNGTIDIQSSQTAVYKFSNNREMAEEVLLNYLKNVSKTVDTSFSDKRTMPFSVIDTLIVECSEIFKSVMNKIIDYGETNTEATADTSKDKPENEDHLNRIKMKEKHKCYIGDDYDDENYPVSKKPRENKR